MTMPADRERDRRSLQDLAKMGSMGGMTPPPSSVGAPNSSAPSGVHRAGEAKGDDSGLINFAAVSQPAPPVAPQATPLANAGLFDDEPASIRPGPVSSAGTGGVSQHLQQPAPSMPPASMPPAMQAHASQAPASFVPAGTAAASSSQQALTEKKKGNGKVIALVLGGLVAVSSMAAGGFFVMKQRAATEASKLAMNTAPTVAPVVAAAPPETKAAEPTPAPEATVDPNAVPVATDPKLALAA